MPCPIDNEEEIPIGNYGMSNSGMIKTIYRKGLSERYGSLMQTIAGLHYNFSFSDEFFNILLSLEENKNEKELKNEVYLHIARNFKRFGWLYFFLYGASPAVCDSFVEKGKHDLERLPGGGLYKPNSTSLRMGDLGYISKAQDDLNISYNTLEDYCLDLENALTTPYKAYQDIGEFVDDKRVQLNTSVIQIENEYYSTIRPKRVCPTGERPVNVLRKEGIEYLELRCVDLDPFSPVGVRRDQLDFMDTLLMYCLLKESPPIGKDEAETIKNNHEKIINNGRDVSQIINLNGDEGTALDFSEKILLELKEISSTLGGSVFKEGKNLWMESIDLQIRKVKNIDETLSGKILNDLLTKNMSFREFGLNLANEHSQYFKTDQQYENPFFEEAAKVSLEKQDEIDAQIEPDFESYLKEYFSQTS
jgi:glutamate--cysteine ligase